MRHLEYEHFLRHLPGCHHANTRKTDRTGPGVSALDLAASAVLRVVVPEEGAVDV